MQLINDLKLHNGPIEKELQAAIGSVLKSGWYALGPQVRAFEEEFADYCGTAHCIGVANGTDAIEIALKGVGVVAGDEVVVAANAGMYSTTAILAMGAEPVYADVSEEDFLLTPQSVAAVVTSKTKAIIVTHLFGLMADLVGFKSLAQKHGLKLVEDCAQAHGAMRDGKRAGSCGDVAAFSFYPTKNLGALGDGGAVVTNHSEVADRCSQLRQYGWSGKYAVQSAGGRNSRLDELQAAILRVKLAHLNGWNERRQHVASLYASQLEHPAIRKPLCGGAEHVNHLYVIQTDARNSLRDHLAQHQIGNEIHYPILDKDQAVFAGKYSHVSLPTSERLASRILSLPCFPELDLKALGKGIEAINAWQPS